MPLTLKPEDWELLWDLDAWFAAGRIATDFAQEHGIQENTLSNFQRRFGVRGKRGVGLISILPPHEPLRDWRDRGEITRAEESPAAVETAREEVAA